MHRLLVLVAVTSGATGSGCSLEPVTADWQDAEAVTGALAIDARYQPDRPRSGDGLRIVTFNVEYGANTDALARAFMTPPLDQADAILVQEIEAYPGEGDSRAARIASTTGMAYVYVPARQEGRGTHGLAIFGRRPLSNPRIMELPDFSTTLKDRRRIAMAVTMDDVDLVDVHLDLQLTSAERIVQLEPATEGLLDTAIVAGDLNTNPYPWLDVVPVVTTDSISDLDVAAMVDDAMDSYGYQIGTRDSGPTQHSVAGELRLDSIYGRDLGLGDHGVARDVDLSDHWPVWLDVRHTSPRSMADRAYRL